MSQENVEVVRRIYEALNARELATGLELIDRDFEWIPDKRDPAPAVRGREEVLRFLQDQIEVLGMKVELEEAFEKGDQVVALVTSRAQPPGGSVDSLPTTGTCGRFATGSSFPWRRSPSRAKPWKPPGCGSRPIPG